jgi:PBSX family phage portal protein
MSDNEPLTGNRTVVEMPTARTQKRSRAMTEVRKARENRLSTLAGLHMLSSSPAVPITKEVTDSGSEYTVDVAKANAVMAGTTSDKSTLREPEQVTSLYESGRLIQPPYNLLSLATLREYSSELWQCLDAMTVNIEGYGHRFVTRLEVNAAPKEVQEAVKQEHADLHNFFEYVDVEEGFTALRLKTRLDIESTGGGYWEVIRDMEGDIVEFKHAPSYQMRLGRSEDKQILVETPILKLLASGEVVPDKIRRYKRFRQYMQVRGLYSHTTPDAAVTSNASAVWFKEFQDPRHFDNITGQEITDKDEVEKARENGRLANEMIYFALYCPRSAYGMPRFIGNMLGIYGDRSAEEINYITFENNNIPSMVISVSNGQLTQGTIDRIESFTESQIQGSDNYSKFLIVEAEGFAEGEDGGQIKIEIKPLTREQHTDAMFQKYSANNRDSIRRAFRIPPILVGRAEDYTRATADASVKLADEQIFAPARAIVDQFLNRRVFPEKGYRYHKFKSNSPDTTDNTELVNLLKDAEKTGGMSPKIARDILSDVLGRPLPPVSDAFNGDVPFSLTMAEAVKNKADPTEPGQQFTALKAIEMLTGGVDENVEVSKSAALSIAAVRSIVEKKLRAMATENIEPHAHS